MTQECASCALSIMIAFGGLTMNRRSVLAGALTLALLLPSCGKPVSRYDFKMTAEVETPRGLKTGSAVQSIEASDIWIKLVEGDGCNNLFII
jgi:hypothetical protein